MKNKAIKLPILLFAFLCSCAGQGPTSSSSTSVASSTSLEPSSSKTESSSVSVEESSSSATSSEESSSISESSSSQSSEESSSIAPSSSSSSSKEEPTGYNLFGCVYADKAPSIIGPETDVVINYDEYEGTLYYKLFENGEYTEIESGDSIFLDYIKYGLNKYYPTTIAVNPDPTGTQAVGKLFSYDYWNNIYQPGNYALKQKMPVVYFKFEDDEGKITEKMFTWPVEQDFDFDGLPVVSLNVAYADLYDGQKGIYNAITEEREARGQVEYFDKKTGEYWCRETKVKLGGNYSKGYPQRTLNLNFNKNNAGDKNDPVNVQIYQDTPKAGDPTSPVTGITRFRLHNGGNCFEERTGFNDAMMHLAMRPTNVATAAARPCMVFLNGEYWGIMTIREHYSDTYFADNYDVKKSTVVCYEYKYNPSTEHWCFDDGNEENAQTLLNELLTYIKTNDFANDAAYETFINDYVDIDSFIDLFIVESFSGNWDFVGNFNNLKMWRVDKKDSKKKYADGKWRFCLHDIDFACDGSFSTVFLSKSDTTQAASQYHYRKFPMYENLAKNKQFRMRFIQRASELIANELSYANMSSVIDGLYNTIKDYKLESQMRWGKKSSYKTEWENIITTTKSWISNRCAEYLGRLQSSLGTWGEIA